MADAPMPDVAELSNSDDGIQIAGKVVSACVPTMSVIDRLPVMAAWSVSPNSIALSVLS